MSDSIKILQDTLTYGSVSATGTLTVSSDSTLKGSVNTGNLTVSGYSVVTGNASVSGDSTLSGSVSTGTLTINGDSTATGNVFVSGYGVFTGSVNTGNLTVGGDSVVTGTGKFSGNTLTLGDQTAQVLITNIPTTSAYPVAQRMVLQGVDGYASGEGTDLYIWAGNGGYRSQADDMDPEGSSRLGSGGDIKIDAGRGQDGGTIKIRGGYSQGAEALSTVSGGFVLVEAGNSQWGVGGDITATAGYGPQGGGSISLTTRNISQTNVWTFSQNGTLSTAGSITFPDGTVQTTAASAVGSTINKFVSSFGNTSDTIYVLDHNLNTEDVVVTVLEVATKNVVYPSVTNTNTNQITIEFSEIPASADSYKAIVIG